MTKNIHGIDHVGITVPDIEKATDFFLKALNAVVIYDTYTKDQPPRDSDFTRKRLGIEKGTIEIAIRMLKMPNGPGFELFEFIDLDRIDPVTPADFGWQHIAFYVDDMQKALAQVEAVGGKRNADPVDLSGVEGGVGNQFCYCKTPWGSFIELITYPTPQLYMQETLLRKWKV